MTDHSFGRICIEQDWRSIPLHVLEDTRLDMPARVVLAWQLAHGNNWTARIGFMRRELQLSESRWSRARDQLVAAGYLKINSFQDEVTGQQCWEFIFSGTPRDDAGVGVPLKRGYPHFPGPDFPGTENSGATNSRLETRELKNNNDVVAVFLEAAGPAGKDLSLGVLSKALGNATEVQARWAGLALKEQVEHADDPSRLAIFLAKLAAEGNVGKPRTVRQEEREKKRQEAEAAYQKKVRDAATSIQPAVVRRGEKLPPLPRATGGQR